MTKSAAISVHHGDLPDGVDLGPVIAVDTETMGLQPARDRLCVVQLSSGDGTAHLVQIGNNQGSAPNLRHQLEDPDRLKLFHFARFDVATLKAHLNIDCRPLWCTKIASKLARTYTDRHGLRDLCRELLDLDISKQQQSSDWGAETLTKEQISYAAGDVLYLHQLKEHLENMLRREDRLDLAQSCFDFVPIRADLDLAGWPEVDIFAH
ncbi:MAG: ribonuclease H-like domain-containing protein [Pseudomonadota bacterium]